MNENCDICGTIKGVIPGAGIKCNNCGHWYSNRPESGRLFFYEDILFDKNKLVSYLFYNTHKKEPKYHERYYLYNGGLTQNALDEKKNIPGTKLVEPKNVEEWYPKNFRQEVGYALDFLAKLSNFHDEIVELSRTHCLSLFFVKRFKEDGSKMTPEIIEIQISFIVDYMKEQGLLDYNSDNDKFLFKILPEGLMRIPELLKD